MPKRIIDEKTGIAPTGREKAKRVPDDENVSSDYVDDDAAEPRGIDEDLANPELEIEDDEDDSISPPPLDGRFAEL